MHGCFRLRHEPDPCFRLYMIEKSSIYSRSSEEILLPHSPAIGMRNYIGNFRVIVCPYFVSVDNPILKKGLSVLKKVAYEICVNLRKGDSIWQSYITRQFLDLKIFAQSTHDLVLENAFPLSHLDANVI